MPSAARELVDTQQVQCFKVGSMELNCFILTLVTDFDCSIATDLQLWKGPAGWGTVATMVMWLGMNRNEMPSPTGLSVESQGASADSVGPRVLVSSDFFGPIPNVDLVCLADD